MSQPLARSGTHRQRLLDLYRTTRSLSLELCEPLEPEDFRIQSMPDVSPPWWNLGHTSWFFAKNILEPRGRYETDDARLEYVLNSYYETHGRRLPRHQRGLVSRPTNGEIFAFRRSVDERLEQLLEEVGEDDWSEVEFLVAAGIQHEQQHQELLLTEIKHILSMPPSELRRPYATAAAPEGRASGAVCYLPVTGGLFEFGNLEGGWCWDNELPVHQSFLENFEILDRLVTNVEYLQFLDDDGYRNPLLWLSNGWTQVQENNWEAPLYWFQRDGTWWHWTLSGDRRLEPDEPVCHVSFYEAEAFARWRSLQSAEARGTRLLTEREWEHAARRFGFAPAKANMLESAYYHPTPASPATGASAEQLRQCSGDLWEWTSSHYEPYPGYRPFEGDLMEYNGKFMDNQRVLRGGSCATPRFHIRASYRNFWPAETRFQFTGIRLARSPR